MPKGRVLRIDTDFEYYGRDRVIKHLEDKYGKDNVAHIGTYTIMGVKSGLKDVGRVLRIDFSVMNEISKKLDAILDVPQPDFKQFDDLRTSDNPDDQKRWQEFNELEQKHKEIFRLARKFEGCPRNFGVHASGILVTPMPVDDMFPVRKNDDGTICTLFTHTQLEELNALKFDILGLKTLSVIKKTLELIDPNLTFNDFYETVDVNDPQIYEMTCNKETDALFQIESDMFKGMIGDIKPTNINDIIAITSLGRPGPLSAGMPQDYAKYKNGLEEPKEPLKGVGDLLEKTHQCICYQEQIMQISMKVAGFDSNQSDSLVRKIFAKKKKNQMEMLRRMFFYGKINADGPNGWESNPDMPWYDPKGKYGKPIKGACNNGYTKEELAAFWEKIQGFCDYLFNLSHAATYSYITVLTAYLKKYYPVQFMTAVLSLEGDDDKKEKYIRVVESMGISVLPPDINKSNIDFTPEKNTILYGLGSIKGVGKTCLPYIIANRPYSGIEDAIKKLPKQAFNKRTAIALIKAGAFDFENPNRYALINKFYDIRKDKDERLNEQNYDKKTCIEMEKEILGCPITHKPAWFSIKNEERFTAELTILEVKEAFDKNGRLMAWVKGIIGDWEAEGVCFASTYRKFTDMFDTKRHNKIIISGTKNSDVKFVIDKVIRNIETAPKSTKSRLLA